MSKTETIYYVSEYDRPSGETEEKLAAHHSETQLHAAFSVYVFRKSDGKFLVQQRAHTKKVWQGVWSNSCCGHPMPGESREKAIRRRLQHELGIDVGEIKLVLPRYIYKTPPYNGIIEHEFCPVYIAMTDNEPQPNPEEVEAYDWMEWNDYVSVLSDDPDNYSVFASDIPSDDKLGKGNIPKWSWWAKDQAHLLTDSAKFREFVESISS